MRHGTVFVFTGTQRARRYLKTRVGADMNHPTSHYVM